jgi:hypothetical protein
MFDNVQFFSHLHLKYAKSAIMTQKIFFLEKYQYGYQKNPEFYVEAKNHEKMHKNENTQNLHSFLALTFFRGICLSRHQLI